MASGEMMKISRLWIIGASLAALVASTPAQAQEAQQTVEGAQEFLSLMAAKRAFQVRVSLKGGQENLVLGKALRYSDKNMSRPLQNSDATIQFSNFTNFDFNRTNYCSSVINIKPPYNIHYVNGKFYGRDASSKFSIDDGISFEDPDITYRSELNIDWGEVKIIRNGVVIKIFTGEGSYIALHTSYPVDAETVDRLEYAVRFLQASCDHSASTGF